MRPEVDTDGEIGIDDLATGAADASRVGAGTQKRSFWALRFSVLLGM
jgi:hypothetical protein